MLQLDLCFSRDLRCCSGRERQLLHACASRCGVHRRGTFDAVVARDEEVSIDRRNVHLERQRKAVKGSERGRRKAARSAAAAHALSRPPHRAPVHECTAASDKIRPVTAVWQGLGHSCGRGHSWVLLAHHAFGEVLAWRADGGGELLLKRRPLVVVPEGSEEARNGSENAVES